MVFTRVQENYEKKGLKEKREYSISHIIIQNNYMKTMYQIAPKRNFRVLRKATFTLPD